MRDELQTAAQNALALLEEMATYTYVKGYPSTLRQVQKAIEELKSALDAPE